MEMANNSGTSSGSQANQDDTFKQPFSLTSALRQNNHSG
jgi:hypothetical protein